MVMAGLVLCGARAQTYIYTGNPFNTGQPYYNDAGQTVIVNGNVTASVTFAGLPPGFTGTVPCPTTLPPPPVCPIVSAFTISGSGVGGSYTYPSSTPTYYVVWLFAFQNGAIAQWYINVQAATPSAYNANEPRATYVFNTFNYFPNVFDTDWNVTTSGQYSSPWLYGSNDGTPGLWSVLAGPLTITTTSLPIAASAVMYLQPYAVTLSATGGSGTGYTWSLISGSLPTGFTLMPGGLLNHGVFLTNGVAPSAAPGSYPFTAAVTDSAGNTVSAQFTLVVQLVPPLTITTTSLSNAIDGQLYSTALAAVGGSGTGYSWSVAGGSVLPLGFTVSSAGVLASSGSSAASPGPATFTVQVTDSASNTATQQLTLVVDPLDASKQLGNQCDGCPCQCAGEPITLGNGNVFEQVADYQTAGSNNLTFSRYYNSRPAAATFAVALGKSWRSIYDRYLNITSSSTVSAERADGQGLSFTLISGVWTGDTDVDVKLAASGSTWMLTDKDDTVETYTANGANSSEALLTSIQARNGYKQTLEYNGINQLISVTDSYNRALSFTYSNSLLQTVTTPDGLTLTYGYNSSGASAGVLDRLASVTYSTSPTTSQAYAYGNAALPFALTGIVDEDGNTYTTWTYDQFGRGLTSQLGNGATLTAVAYDDTTGNRTVTNALGEQELYKFTTLQGVAKITEIDRLATATTSAATRLSAYDSNGYLASQTDWNGNLTTYVNDVHGQPLSVTEASGTAQARTTATTYLANFHLPAQIVTPGLTVNFAYDTSGNLLTKTAVDTTTTTVPYSTNGVSRTWTYTWSNFLMASAQGPRTDAAELTKFTYDSSGALTKTTNALNQSTQITLHLPGGLPETIVDPNGVTTQLAYDPRLRRLTSAVTTSKGVLTTKIAYDAAGNPLTVTLPDGATLTSAYDVAHRLTKTSDLFSQSMAYTLDALGDRTQTNVSNAAGTVQRKHSGVFDALGRILNDTGGVGQTTTYTYDSNGNALTAADPLQHATQQAFDALNRRVKVTDATGSSASTAYDAHDRTVSVTDPNGNTTSYVYSGFGDLIQQVSPVTGTTVYHFDLAGNLTQKTDANGAVTNHTYDALDRALATTFPADSAENVAISYDQTGHGFGVGGLTTVTDAAGTLSRSYDERGNITSETRTRGAATLLTSYGYDAASRIASVTYPSGWTIAYTRDSMGRSTAVNGQAPGTTALVAVVSKIGYQPFGPAASLTYGNGIAETRSFDLDYRLTTLAASGSNAVQSLTYGYDLASNVLSIADGVTSGKSQALGYDVLNRLTSAAGAYGSFTYTYDKLGNRLTGIPGGAATATTVAELDGMSPVTNLAYNQAGRLATVSAAAQQLAQYTYDAFGQRLVKVQPAISTTTLYQYGQNGLLLEESNNQGNPASADYIYLDDGRPVATLAPAAGKLYFTHDDRLGTPQLLTGSSQTAVWSASYEPFGQTSAVSTGATVENLRLPGQYFDAESGLNHNGFRDYVPNWGRYVESDPIGLGGGLNTFAYVGGNPVTHIDRNGRAAEAGGQQQNPSQGSNMSKLQQLFMTFGITWLSTGGVPTDPESLAGSMLSGGNTPSSNPLMYFSYFNTQYNNDNITAQVKMTNTPYVEQQSIPEVEDNFGLRFIRWFELHACTSSSQ